MRRALVWFRQDLRLSDQPALAAACQECAEVIPLFIDDPSVGSYSHLGAASRVWLHHSLLALEKDLSKQGSRLIIRQGVALDVLQQLIAEAGITHVYWNRCYDPTSRSRDETIKQTLKARLKVQSFNANLLYEPWQLLKADGTPYRVYTPFWKAMLKQGLPPNLTPNPANLKPATKWPTSLEVDALACLPDKVWPGTMMAHWQVGEQAAWQRLAQFLDDTVAAYSESRDRPAEDGTSQLSAHLHFGEISPRQLAFHAQQFLAQQPQAATGVETFLREIVWREFAYHLLYHFPQTVDQPLDSKFAAFAWRAPDDYADDLKRWQRGQTGIPLVDAGMRQLWQTGWMHNRVRMVAASWLTKNLLIPWQEGERWFRDTLVDADLASNVMGWQWVAGCGADAAPYFRVFNPVLQGEKFDPNGDYIRRWLPELAGRATKVIHQPRVLGDGLKYPLATTDTASSRQRALDCYKQLRT